MNQYFFSREGGGPDPLTRPIKDLRHMEDHVRVCLIAEGPFATIKKEEDALLLGKAGSSGPHGKRIARAVAQRFQHVQRRSGGDGGIVEGPHPNRIKISFLDGLPVDGDEEEAMATRGRGFVEASAAYCAAKAGGSGTRRRVAAPEVTVAERRTIARAAFPNERPLFFSGGPHQYPRSYHGPTSTSVLPTVNPHSATNGIQTRDERRKELATLYTYAADCKAPDCREVNDWKESLPVQDIPIAQVRALQQPTLDQHDRRRRLIEAAHSNVGAHRELPTAVVGVDAVASFDQRGTSTQRHRPRPSTANAVTSGRAAGPFTPKPPAQPDGGKVFRQAAEATAASTFPVTRVVGSGEGSLLPEDAERSSPTTQHRHVPRPPRPATCSAVRPEVPSVGGTAVATATWMPPPVAAGMGAWMSNDITNNKRAFEAVRSRRDELLRRRLFNATHANVDVVAIPRSAALSASIPYSVGLHNERTALEHRAVHHSRVSKLKKQTRRRKATELLLDKINTAPSKVFNGVSVATTDSGGHLYFMRDGRQILGKDLGVFLEKTLAAHEATERHRTRPMSGRMKDAIRGMAARLHL